MPKRKRSSTHPHTSRHTKRVYKYAGRKEFGAKLIEGGYTPKTAQVYVTGIVNSGATTFAQARKLWLQHMIGKPFPLTGEEQRVQDIEELNKTNNKETAPSIKPKLTIQKRKDTSKLVDYKFKVISIALADRQCKGATDRQTVDIILTILGEIDEHLLGTEEET